MYDTGGIPNNVKQFIFEYIDSVEQLDVLLLLRAHQNHSWTAKLVSDELRTNPVSAENRLLGLKVAGLIENDGPSEGLYRYCPVTSTLSTTVDDLASACQVRRHKVYELIFSPMKRARKFADAFMVLDPKKDGGTDG